MHFDRRQQSSFNLLFFIGWPGPSGIAQRWDPAVPSAKKAGDYTQSMIKINIKEKFKTINKEVKTNKLFIEHLLIFCSFFFFF